MIPSRQAASVATVDLPVPVAPPTSTISGVVHLPEVVVEPQPAAGALALLAAEHLDGELLEPVERERLLAAARRGRARCAAPPGRRARRRLRRRSARGPSGPSSTAAPPGRRAARRRASARSSGHVPSASAPRASGPPLEGGATRLPGRGRYPEGARVRAEVCRKCDVSSSCGLRLLRRSRQLLEGGVEVALARQREHLVVGEHDRDAALGGGLGDDVDRGGLDLDDVDVGVECARGRARSTSRRARLPDTATSAAPCSSRRWPPQQRVAARPRGREERDAPALDRPPAGAGAARTRSSACRRELLDRRRRRARGPSPPRPSSARRDPR